MRAIFFADLSLGVGRGHWSRCCALGYVFQCFGIGVDLRDSRELLEAFTDKKIFLPYDIVVIDSYVLELAVYEWIAEQIPYRIFFDDTLRLDYPQGIILNGAFGADKSLYARTYPKHRLWLGSGFLLAQRAFLELTPQVRVAKEAQKILLSLGSGDILKLMPSILEWLCDFYGTVYCVGVDLEEAKKTVKNNYIFYENINASAMAELLSNADIAIIGAGQSLVEAIMCGIPSIAFSLVANQEANITPFLADNSMVYPISKAWELDKTSLKRVFLKAFSHFLPTKARQIARNTTLYYRNNLQWKCVINELKTELSQKN